MLNYAEDYALGLKRELDPRLDDSRLADLFAREVVSALVRKELITPEWAERLLSWQHTGFNVHSRVRAKTKTEAEFSSCPGGDAGLISGAFRFSEAF